MFDLNFYMSAFALKKFLKNGHVSVKYAFDMFEEFRSEEPFVFNIETTNNCNHTCKMCPRTTLMTRPIQNLSMKRYEKVVKQLRPWTDAEWSKWEDFAEEFYRVDKNSMSENHFFLYVIPKVVVLHGYGSPLLDRNMAERVRLLSDRNIPSYFSCNPANIKPDKLKEIFEAGLDYIKFSIESIDDLIHKKVRGEASNFTVGYRKILKSLEWNLDTKVVITMLNLNREDQLEDYQMLVDKFKDKDVYIFLKSQDCLWYDQTGAKTESINWSEVCQFPWSSMTVKSDGSCTQCVEDYNNDVVLGHVDECSLKGIWNGEKYKEFRKAHFTRSVERCVDRCDMTIVGDYSE